MASIWANWIIARTGRSISYNFAETFFRYLAFQKPDPNYDIKSFKIETDLPRLQSISGILDAKNPDLTRFKARGGKIVMYFGWADTALNPLMGVNYYEKVSARFGASTADFFRLFMVPGMSHCRGGVGTDQCDFLTALIEWVEKGVTPKQIVASQSRDGKESEHGRCAHIRKSRSITGMETLTTPVASFAKIRRNDLEHELTIQAVRLGRNESSGGDLSRGGLAHLRKGL